MLTNLRHEFKAGTLFNSVLSGLLVGTIAVVNAVTYGNTVFSETGDPSLGIHISLISGLILSLLFGLFGSLSGIVALPQAAVVPVFTVLVAKIVADMQGQSPEAVTATILAAMAFASLTMGVACLILGTFRLGDIIRYMPVPVSGGFLAGLGWLLLTSGYKTAVGQSFGLANFRQFTQLWVPALILGLLLFITQQKRSWSWMTPILILLPIVGFYAYFNLMQPVSIADLREQGWLLELSQDSGQGIFRFPPVDITGPIDWMVILKHYSTAMILLFTALIGLLMNINGIEMGVKEDVNPNREMFLSGLGNIASMAVGGGIVGYPAAALTTMTYQRGKPGRLTSLIVAGLFGLALYYGLNYVSYLPRFVLGALLFSMGINFLYEWLIQGLLKFSFADYMVVLVMFLAITVVEDGLVYGVVMGVMLTGLIFAIRYSKTNVIRSVLTGRTFQSNVDRPMKHLSFLKERGDELFILRLQGFIFFGTAYSVYRQVAQRLEDRSLPPVRFVLLDFTQTSGVDSSAAMVFNKMKSMSEKYNFELIFCAMNEYVQHKLERNNFTLEGTRFYLYETLDYATEECEKKLLNSSNMTVVTSSGLMSNIGEYFTVQEYDSLFDYMERRNVQAGDKLFTQGENVSMLYLIERGLVTVYRELNDGRRVRLRRMGAGMIVGETGMYLRSQASATVTADINSELFVLTDEGLKRMEHTQPELAAKFHRYIIQMLGQRLQNMNASVQALLE